jgi:SPP1 gp7 family putative phage head morphogenesis protein
MTDKEYWTKRAIQYNNVGDKTANKVISKITNLYKNFIEDIKNETLAFYGKYAEKTGLSISDVKKLLDPKELKSYRENLKRYYDRINELKVNGKLTKEVLTQYKRELDELSARSYMSRLEALKSQLKYHIIKLGVKEDNELSSELKELEKDIYVRSCYDIDTFRGYTYGFAGLSETQLNKLVNERWLGDNYSSRVWKNKEKLIDNINNTLVTGIARGFNPNKIAEEMKGDSESGLYVFERLCRTECSHILNEARMQSYRDTNVNEYEFIGTLDNTTCEECGSFDGNHYKLSDKVEGVNFPPLHPNCRCSTAPYFERDKIDDETDKIFGEETRISKNADGKIQYVSDKMTFKEWKELQNK